MNDLQSVLIAATGATSIFLVILSFIPSRNPLAQRIESLQQVNERSREERLARMERIIAGERTGRLQKQLVEAGWYNVSPLAFSVRGLGAFAFGIMLCLAAFVVFGRTPVTISIGILIALIAWRLPHIVLQRAVKARKVAIERALPNYVDMLATTVGAGLALNAAMIQAVDVAVGALGDELRSALAEVRLGRSRADALTDMAKRVNEPLVSTMVTALLQAESLGANVSDVLRQLSVEARNHRWHVAEERAAQLPVKMVFPMALLMLPSLYVFIFGTVAASLLKK